MKQTAGLGSRVIAAIIDSGIGWVLALVVPVVGSVLSTAYLLVKDAVVYHFIKDEDWRNRSIGKKLMNLELETPDDRTVDFTTSIVRNIPLSIGSLIAIFPVLGWLVGPAVALIIGIIELVLLITDPERRRLGDRLGSTKVVESSNELKKKISV